MAGVDDSHWFGKALIAMLDDQRQTAVSELFVSSARTYRRNEPIYSAGEPGREMFVVTRGRVRLYYENSLGEKIDAREIGAGEQFGEIALIDAGPQPFTAIAMDDVEVLVLNRGDFEELIGRYPHLAIGLLTENCKWLRLLARQLRDQSAEAINSRMAQGRSWGERLADVLSRRIGSSTALIVLAIFVLGWLYFGQFGMQGLAAFHAFDPFPYPSLNLAMTILSAVQLPIILMALNRSSDRERAKSSLDAEADGRVEIELSRLQAKLDRNYEELRKAMVKAEAARGPDAAPRRSA